MQILFSSLLLCLIANVYAMTPGKSRQFVKDAVIYALTNKDPNMDYSNWNYTHPMESVWQTKFLYLAMTFFNESNAH